MRLVLDGETAYEYWMLANPSVIYTPDKSPRQLLTSFERFSSRDVSQSIGRQEGISGPIQLLVDSRVERRDSSSVECRVWSARQALPPKSIYDIGAGLHVVSPELCLVRLATMLPYLELLHRLTNMLGLFAFDFWERMELVERDPITTIGDIERYLDKIPGARGTKQLRDALGSVAERSRSPRESDLILCLRMSARRGGQALPDFEVNHRVELDDAARPLTTKTYLEGDIVWPEKRVAMEYNSDEWHLNTLQAMTDLEKITAMQRMGMTVFPVTTRQFSDYKAFRSLVQGVRQALGIRNPETEKMDTRRTYLHADLMEVGRKERGRVPLSQTARWQFIGPRLDYANT